MKLYLLTILLTTAFLFNCYTSFKHPAIESVSADFYDVRVSDDCMECHRIYPGSLTILPKGAIDDYNWHFYSYSPWWQDVVSVHAGPENYLAPTGPRLPNPPSGHEGSVSLSGPEPAPMISKPVNVSNEGEPESENDSRREFQRRKESTEESNQRDSKRRTPQKN